MPMSNQSAHRVARRPLLDQTISVMLPTSLPGRGKFVADTINSPDLSTDGLTLLRKGGTVVYDLEFHDRNIEWANNIIKMREPEPLPASATKLISDHSYFIHLQAPNWDIAQSTGGQVDLAVELLKTLDPLMRVLGAPGVLLRNANRVHTLEEIEYFNKSESTENLVRAFAKLYNAADEMFSAGMHALGYADVQAPNSVIPVNSLANIIEEFLIFEMTNEISATESKVEFRSAVTGATHQLERCACHRFNKPGEARFNPKGVWVFRT